MYINNNKQLLAAIAMLSAVWSQNDGLVITNMIMMVSKQRVIMLAVFAMVTGLNTIKEFGGMTMGKMEKPTQKTPWKVIIDGTL